jgi:hypothetical protein
VNDPEKSKEGISLRNWFMIISSSRCFGELMQECMGQPSQRNSTVFLFHELSEGVDVLMREDLEDMERYISQKKVTIIGGPKESVQAYLNGDVKRGLSEKMCRYGELRDEISGRFENLMFSDSFQAVVAMKYTHVLIDILSRFIGYFAQLYETVDNPSLKRTVARDSIKREFDRLHAALNHLILLKVACGGSGDFTEAILDYFQVSPFDMNDLIKLFEELMANGNQPDISLLPGRMRDILSDKLSERYSVPVTKINQLLEENAQRVQSVTGEGLSGAASFLLRDSLTDEDCREIHRFSSFIDLLQSGRSNEAEMLYRQYLFFQGEEELHDFTSDNQDFQYWRQLKILTENASPEAAGTLKRVGYEILGKRPSVAKTFPRNPAIVRHGFKSS